MSTYVGHTTTPANADMDQYAGNIATALATAQAAQASAATALANAATAQAAADAANVEMGQLVNILTPATAGGQGKLAITAAGTPQQIGAGSVPIRSLTVTALASNTGRVAWGWSNAVRATVGGEVGSSLAPGESVTVAVSDLNKLWFDAAVSTQGISYTYLV